MRYNVMTHPSAKSWYVVDAVTRDAVGTPFEHEDTANLVALALDLAYEKGLRAGVGRAVDRVGELSRELRKNA